MKTQIERGREGKSGDLTNTESERNQEKRDEKRENGRRDRKSKSDFELRVERN